MRHILLATTAGEVRIRAMKNFTTTTAICFLTLLLGREHNLAINSFCFAISYHSLSPC